MSLRDPGKQWAGNILRDGARATIGPVADVHDRLPQPAESSRFLVTGEYTLVECYARSTLLTSWMMGWFGDPLYNPFKAAPRLQGVGDHAQPARGGSHLRG